MIALLFAAAVGTLDTPAVWTQFRLAPSNNAVVRGSMRTTWKLQTNGAFSSSPTLAGGLLYIGNNKGELFAIDPASGKVKWSVRVANSLMSAPLVYANLVIVGEGNEESPVNSTPTHPIHVGSATSALLAFDRLTGAPVWRKTLQGSGMAMPAIVDGILVQHNGGGYVLGLDPASGATRYSVNLHSIASMSAAVPFPGGRFASSGVQANDVFMLRARDASVLWRTHFNPTGSGLGDCPMASDGARLFCSYVTPPSSAIPMQTERASIARAFALDAATGKKLWDTEIGRGIVPIRNECGIPLVLNGTVFMGTSLAPYVSALDTANGLVRWRFRAHGAVKGGIVELGGVLYFGDFGGYLWAVNARSGAVIGARRMHVPFNVGSPIIAGETLVIGAKSGTLFAMPLAAIRSGKDR